MSNTPTITFSQSNKGKRVLVCDGYVYHLKKSCSKVKYWRYENRLCAAVIHTDINDRFKVREVTEVTPIGCIYDEEVAKAQLSQTALNIVASAQDASKYLCLSSLNRIRRLETPLLLKSCRFDIPTLYNHKINVERFLLYNKMRRNKRILIFATDDQLGVLFKAKQVLMDGTSSSCPLFFEQAYTLHAVKFEQSEFSMCACSSHGSLFYRNIRELRLTNTCKDDANARNFCRRLMVLPLLPLHEVEFAFEEPTEQRPDVLAPIFVYFDNYWMKQISLTLWNVSDLKTRTNNNCEEIINHFIITSIQNFVLHLHVHYANQYRLHGSLSNLRTFGQESLLGYFAKNRHGTHHFGELITNNYNVDFTIHNQPNSHSSSRTIEVDRLVDVHESSISGALQEYHNALCSCDKIDQCVSIYRRCQLKHMVYHSLLYRRRGSSVSYFVQYSKGHDDNLFGKIDLFFKCNNKNFALIHNHRLKYLFTDYFLSSNYHDIFLKALNVYFYVLHHTSTLTDVVTVDNISNMCVVFTFNDSLVVTPLSSSYEHD
ncbi:unnamed protein product [Rotaria socialis]|uniref:FLYWCH-type domain-containing protein n=1 Tax=Rotaria socialis TaxID=392032 RepID=A0A818B2Q3_9BILA|nr:unnamed protein product [Rotaria socialis]CAF4154551.1 unnamed protein product [Rotaria socialis]